MTKETKHRLIGLSEAMRAKAEEIDDKELAYYARQLAIITNSAYEQSLKEAMGEYYYRYLTE